MTTMTEEEWEQRFLPFNHPSDDGRIYFECDEDDEAFLRLLPDCHIWTQVTEDLSDGGWSITYIPGRDQGDGPIVTLRPWTKEHWGLVVEVDTHHPQADE